VAGKRITVEITFSNRVDDCEIASPEEIERLWDRKWRPSKQHLSEMTIHTYYSRAQSTLQCIMEIPSI